MDEGGGGGRQVDELVEKEQEDREVGIRRRVDWLDLIELAIER